MITWTLYILQPIVISKKPYVRGRTFVVRILIGWFTPVQLHHRELVPWPTIHSEPPQVFTRWCIYEMDHGLWMLLVYFDAAINLDLLSWSTFPYIYSTFLLAISWEKGYLSCADIEVVVGWGVWGSGGPRMSVVFKRQWLGIIPWKFLKWARKK